MNTLCASYCLFNISAALPSVDVCMMVACILDLEHLTKIWDRQLECLCFIVIPLKSCPLPPNQSPCLNIVMMKKATNYLGYLVQPTYPSRHHSHCHFCLNSHSHSWGWRSFIFLTPPSSFSYSFSLALSSSPGILGSNICWVVAGAGGQSLVPQLPAL